MKELIIECVDDGCEGFLRAHIGDKTVQSDCEFSFLMVLLDVLGYDVEYKNLEEFNE